jgi:signal transduction histidine kinase
MAQDVLTLSVFNTIAPDQLPGEAGIGLSNVRERLAVQFEGRASLAASGAGGEWCSEITMPAIHESPVVETRHAVALVGA